MTTKLTAEVSLARVSFTVQTFVSLIKTLIQFKMLRSIAKSYFSKMAWSSSKSGFDTIVAVIKRLCWSKATFRGDDEAYNWLLLFIASHPNFQRSSRVVEVRAKSDLVRRRQRAVGRLKKESKSDGGCKGEEIKGEGMSAHLFPAGNASMHFVFQGTHFWAFQTQTGTATTKKTGHNTPSITLYTISPSSLPLHRLLEHVKEVYEEQSHKKVSIYRLNSYNEWSSVSGISKRRIDTLHLPGQMKETIIQDAKHFLDASTEQWYAERGIPYRRGYLFYGPPGNGKSTLCHVLASELDMRMYILSLQGNRLDDVKFIRLMSNIPEKSIVLIEDVDAAFASRQPSRVVPKSLGGEKGTGDHRVSFSALLNAIDGVDATESRLLCLTTNHIARLDEALIRPGRVDCRFEFPQANEEQARHIFLRFFRPKTGSTPLDVVAKADQFAMTFVGGGSCSVAALQAYLLSHANSYEEAANEAPRWVIQQAQERQDKSVKSSRGQVKAGVQATGDKTGEDKACTCNTRATQTGEID